MTERKPAGTSFTSWIDQQVQEAEERGDFDNLPGSGKPLPRRSAAEDGLAWLREKLLREGVSTDELLPTPLKLRKQAERLAGSLQDLPREQDVRDAVAELNRQIVEWRRIPDGPNIYVPLVNAEQMVSRWRETHPRPPAPRPSAADAAAEPARQTRQPSTARPGWWHRFGRRSRSGRAASERG
jgi:hypothetical protein